MSHFSFDGGHTLLDLEQEIDSHLSAIADREKDIPQLRKAMAFDLATKATSGDAVVEASDFFRQHGLNAVPLSDWSRLRSIAQNVTHTYLATREYRTSDDVRFGSSAGIFDNWPLTTPVLALSGESGQGKSWHGYGIAEYARHFSSLVVIINGAENVDATLNRAASAVWHSIAGHDESIPLSRIAARFQKVVKAQHRWLLLIIDGVSEVAKSIELAQQPWETWGVRVVVTCATQGGACDGRCCPRPLRSASGG